MLSFHVKFVQTDRQTEEQMDNGESIFRYRGIKTGLSDFGLNLPS